MTVRHQTSCWLIVLPIVAGVGAPAQTASTVPSVDTIVARMARARTENRAQFRPYTVTREYRMFGQERDKTKSRVTAEVAFVPPGSKQYTIQQTVGSGMGGMIVRRILTNEAEAAKDYASSDFSPENYDFRLLRQEEFSGRPCYVLELNPRRQDVHLVRGNLWVDADTFLPRRFEGELAKSPSWWVRDLRVSFDYGEAGGMWLPTASQASANLRFLGRSSMVSQDVSYKFNGSARPMMASLHASPHLAHIVRPRH